MSKYLYGASVQGLQEFIFKTNKLKEIIGASEIIKNFDKLELKKEFDLKEDATIILQAAGNLRVIFKNKEDLEKVVLKLPQYMMLKAYGVTISQAVVEYKNYKDSSQELEKLLKIQRNKSNISLDTHFNIIQQNPRTALPLIDSENDKATAQKIVEFKKFAKEIKKDDKDSIFDISYLSNKKNKIAIIHIDGNGLGNIVKDLTEADIKMFSKKLDDATNEAFKECVEKVFKSEDSKLKKRDVILGGDDVTLICDANQALDFTKYFLELFEEKTKNIYTNKEKNISYDLTACAGVVFCNEKYPFHYAVKLAEDLCSFAKKDSKKYAKEKKLNLAPSSLMFHNIQSSNVESFSKFIEDELTINGIRCDFGPYYLKEIENKISIKKFQALVDDFKKENSPIAKLRDWLTTLSHDKNLAKLQLERINQISKDKWDSKNLYEGTSLKNLIVKKDGLDKTPVYDVLQILSVTDEKEGDIK